jgi:hypothetical protein
VPLGTRNIMSTATHFALIVGLTLGCTLGLSRFDPRIGLAGVSCKARDFGPSAMRGDRVEGDWLVYRNTKNGLSFRYPSSMQIKEQDPASFGYDKAFTPDVIVDLRAHDSTVMRFICASGEQTPAMAAAKILRQANQAEDGCGTLSMQIDGHKAIEAVVGSGCGRNPNGRGAVCTWRIATYQPRECDIFPLGNGRESDHDFPPAHDGQFPLLSIIQTVHFEPRKRRLVRHAGSPNNDASHRR